MEKEDAVYSPPVVSLRLPVARPPLPSVPLPWPVPPRRTPRRLGSRSSRCGGQRRRRGGGLEKGEEENEKGRRGVLTTCRPAATARRLSSFSSVSARAPPHLNRLFLVNCLENKIGIIVLVSKYRQEKSRNKNNITPPPIDRPLTLQLSRPVALKPVNKRTKEGGGRSGW